MSDAVVAASAASGAWTAASAPPAIPLRRDAEEGFPVGGATLLVALMIAAAWAWWYGRTHGLGRMPARGAAWPARLRGASRDDGELKVLSSAQAAPGVRLIVVEWSGGRVLVGVNGTSAPVALDRTDAGDAAKPGEPS